MFHLLFLTLLCGYLSDAFAAHEEYKDNSLFFYTVAAAITYEKSLDKAQRKADELFKQAQKNETLKVVGYKKIKHENKKFGSTRILAIKDKKGKHHVAVEGSDDAQNRGGDIWAPIRGIIKEYDFPADVCREVHKEAQNFKKSFGNIITLIGHCRGGGILSQIAHRGEFKDKYANAHILTFTGFKIKSGSNQDHFLAKKEHICGSLSPRDRYIEFPFGKGHLKFAHNHGLEPYLDGFQDKDWRYIEEQKKKQNKK